MKDVFAYHIKLGGQVNENEINSMSPLQITFEDTLAVKKDDLESTLFTVCTDQSGLIGLMRHLHGLGFVFLAVNRLD
jgi:hypothetical protein